MKYLDGQPVRLGDVVDLGGGMTGVVVCLFDERLFDPGFQKLAQGGPDKGVMVNSAQAGLVHFPKPDVDLVLLHRAP